MQPDHLLQKSQSRKTPRQLCQAAGVVSTKQERQRLHCVSGSDVVMAKCRQGRYNLDPSVKFFATPPVHGSLARYVDHPADFCFKLPDSLSYEQGAMVEPLSNAGAPLPHASPPHSVSLPLYACLWFPIFAFVVLSTGSTWKTPEAKVARHLSACLACCHANVWKRLSGLMLDSCTLTGRSDRRPVLHTPLPCVHHCYCVCSLLL